MGFNSLFVYIPVGIILIAFVYVNFIFPQKAEKEKRIKDDLEKEEKKKL
jgi:Na+/melibiose symporter-like transporter